MPIRGGFRNIRIEKIGSNPVHTEFIGSLEDFPLNPQLESLTEGRMAAKTAALTPAKRRLPGENAEAGDGQFLIGQGYCGMIGRVGQARSSFDLQRGYLSDIIEHANKPYGLNGDGYIEKGGSFAVEINQFAQAYPATPNMSIGTPYPNAFPLSKTFSSSMCEKASSAWKLNVNSFSSSLGDFCASQRYLPNEHHRVVANCFSNLCGNNITLPNSTDVHLGGEHFVPDYGLSTYSEFPRMTELSFPTPNPQNMCPVVLSSDMIKNSRLVSPFSNVQAPPQVGHSLLNSPKQANSMQYRPHKNRIQNSRQFSIKSYGDSSPIHSHHEKGHELGKERSSLYHQVNILDAPTTVREQSGILHPLLQRKQNGIQLALPSKANLHVTSNSLAAICESKALTGQAVELQDFLYLYDHASSCLGDCELHNCKLMKEILDHLLNCHNNICGQNCMLYKNLLVHYEECYRSDCSICPPIKRRLNNLQNFNSSATVSKASIPIFTSEYRQSSANCLKNGQEPSACTTEASELTCIEHASCSPQKPISNGQECRTLNYTAESNKLEMEKSPKFLKESNAKVCDPAVEINSILPVAKLVCLGKVVECELKDLQNNSLSCKEDDFEELIAHGRACSASQQAILQSLDLPTPIEIAVEGMMVEGKISGDSEEKKIKTYEADCANAGGTVKHNPDSFCLEQVLEAEKGAVEIPLSLASADEIFKEESRACTPLHVPNLCYHVLDASIDSTVEEMKSEANWSENSSGISKSKCPERKFEGLYLAMEVQQSFEPVSSEGIVAESEQQSMQPWLKCCEVEAELNHGSSTFSLEGTNLRKGTERAISLLNLLTPRGVREHIGSLMQSNNQAKTPVEKLEEPGMKKNVYCRLCGMDKLLFHPPLRYCLLCKRQINPHGVYYSMKDFDNTASVADASKSFCNQCYAKSGENIKFAKQSISKLHLERKTNYAETDGAPEVWVQCDKCKDWLHEICALFNGKLKNEQSGQIEYTCPICCLQDLENGVCEPLQRMAIGAKELPRTKLSDHIEEWLFRRLGEERQERARTMGKNFNEVSTAEDLVVRVVASADTKFEVKPCFRAIFHEEKYPLEFSYKSKAVILFQIIEGADVLLFAMYVQEYGSESSDPNGRHVCISYIDSVKYFRPEIKTVNGEALRTFVYHEFLIGYLDYCKKRWFTSCHIWTCPPLKHDDYILYCHPRAQKIPKSDKLREWYQKMIRKASKEKIVMEHTNLYDHYFVQTSESKVKITMARLPYFDNDFWPGEAERLLQNYDGNKPEKKAKTAKAVIQRALRAARRDASLIENEKDVLLMNNLRDIIRPIKEDFIVLFLHPICAHCCQPIIFGERWICNMCKNFQLCVRCHSIEEKLQNKDRHPINGREKHSFNKVEPDSVLRDTIDEDETTQSEIFNTRLEFLNFCQGNKYQFDTLRRAKYSTMMILYHLHNPAPPAFAPTYSNGMDDTQSLHSTMIWSDAHQFDSDYHEERNGKPNFLLNTRLQREEMHTLMDVLMHSSKCGNRTCTYRHCRQLKVAFHHGATCCIRKKGGCELCTKVWHIIFMHARFCRELECSVPRCRDLRKRMTPSQDDFTESRRKSDSEKLNFLGGS